MALELTTAGIKVKYAFESSQGVKPTSGFTAIPGIKSIPEFGGEPNALDCTPLDETVSHRYVMGLRDPGGVIGLTVNDYTTFRTAWSTMLTGLATAKGSGLAMWIEYAYPAGSGLDSFYFTADATDILYGGADVDEVLENVAYIVPTGTPQFASASS